MTTTIIALIAVVLLVALGAKLFSKKSSQKGQDEASGSSDTSASAIKKADAGAIIDKAMDLSSGGGGGGVKGEHLYSPPPITPTFTGRKELLKHIMSQTTTRPILIGINGFSGIGKTCMAIALRKQFAPHFSKECLFMDMQGNHPSPPTAQDIMRRIILKFHPSQPLPADDTKLAKLYRVVLKKSKGILILDNAANSEQVKSLTPPVSWLLIVTSTKSIALPKMVCIPLEPMEILESRTLLTRSAPEIGPAIKEISLICKGVPFSLEIIGKLFAINSTMAPDYFSKKFLEARLKLGKIEEEEPKDRFINGVRASLSLCYQMLPEATVLILKKLTVFPESFTANAETFICEDPKNLALIGLVKFGLVQHNTKTDRFSVHEQVKKYVKPMLTSSIQATTQKRLATEFMNILETANYHIEKGGKETIKGFRLFDLELENIKAGMKWSQKLCSSDKDAARVCSAYTENGATLISQRLSPAQAIQWFEAALSAAKLLEDKEAERKHILNLGQQYVKLNQTQKAMDTLQQALTLSKKEGVIKEQQTALHLLSQICLKKNDYTLANNYIEEGIELVRANNDDTEEFKLLTQLTESCALNKEYNKATHTGEQALDLAEPGKEKPLQVNLLFHLGQSYLQIGETEKALEYLQKGVEVSQKTPKTPLLGELFKLVGDTVFKAGDVAGALKHLEKGLEAVRKIKAPLHQGTLMVQLAEIHMQNKNEERAIQYFEEALILSQKIKDRWMEGKTLWAWGQALGERGALDEAIIRGQKALKIYKELNKPETTEIQQCIDNWSST